MKISKSMWEKRNKNIFLDIFIWNYNVVREKEVRLKIRLEKYCTEEAPSKLRIPLTDAAFDELVLEFSPEFPEDDKSEFLKKVHNLLPESTIVNSKGQKYSIGL